MYLKQGSIYTTNNLDYLPLNELQVGDQIILLGDKELNRSRRDDKVNGTNILVVSQKIEKHIIDFDAISLEVDYKGDWEYDDDDNEVIIEEEAYLEDRRFNHTYFKLKDELYLLSVEKSRSTYARLNYLEDALDECHEIYECLFNKPLEQIMLVDDNVITNQVTGRMIKFYPFKLDDQSYLTFITTNNFNHYHESWIKKKEVIIFQKDKKMITLNTNFDNLFEKIESLESERYTSSILNYRERFKKHLNIMKYNLRTYAISKSYERYDMISKIYSEFSRIMQRNTIEKFFSPVYVNKDLEFEVFFDKENNYNHNTIYIYKGNNEWTSNLKKIEGMELELRKATAVVEFSINNKYGVSPFDGKFYKHGTEQELYNLYDYYHDDEGTINKIDFYLKIDGFYLKVTDEEKKSQRMKEVIERRDLAVKLDAML